MYESLPAPAQPQFLNPTGIADPTGPPHSITAPASIAAGRRIIGTTTAVASDVASLAKLGKDVITTHIDSGQSNKLEELVNKLTDVDWEKSPTNPWMRSQAGFAGQKELYNLLYKLVYNDVAPEGVDDEEIIVDEEELEEINA